MMLKRLLFLSLFPLFWAACSVGQPAPPVTPAERETTTPIEATFPETKASATPSPTVAPTPTRQTTPSPTIQPTSTPPPVPTLTSTPEGALAMETMPHLTPGQPVTLQSIHMSDALSGWGLAGTGETSDHVLHTSDGGWSWQDVSPPEPLPIGENFSLRATAFFLDGRTAWVVYAPDDIFNIPTPAVVWRTIDGGESWSRSAPLNVEQSEFYNPSILQFVNDTVGWLMVGVGAGMSHQYVFLYQTRDGGANWERIMDPTTGGPQGCQKTGMRFAGETTGWITRNCMGVMEGAMIDQSDDGGAHWQEIPLPLPPEETLLPPQPADSPSLDTMLICWTHSPMPQLPAGRVIVQCGADNGYAIRSSHFLYETADGGQTWQRFDYPGGQLIFFDENIGLALGKDIYRTEDGGRKWERISFVTWEGQFSFVDEQRGWAVARAGDDIALVQSIDGGRTWELLQPLIVP